MSNFLKLLSKSLKMSFIFETENFKNYLNFSSEIVDILNIAK